MNKSVKIITGILGMFMLLPGLAKFTEPFKTFIYQQLENIGFPFLDIMPLVVKISEVGLGLALIFLAFKGATISSSLRNKIFYLGNLSIIVMMIVAVYTHLHPDVPAEILPMGFKPPVMPISYIVLVIINLILNRKQPK